MKKINPQAMQIAGCLHDWLEHYVPSIKACSRHTQRSYHISMTLYAEFLRTVKGVTPETLNADCFCKKNIEEWIVWMKNIRNCSPTTCNVRLSALRVFFEIPVRQMTYHSFQCSCRQRMYRMKKHQGEKWSDLASRLLTRFYPCPTKEPPSVFVITRLCSSCIRLPCASMSF